MNNVSEATKFSTRISRLLERVTYRRIDSADQKETIFRMRYAAYSREGSIAPRASGMFHDEYDESPNVWLIGVFVDGELVSSIRLHVSASPRLALPVAKVFPDLVTPLLNARKVVVDGSRFVSNLEGSHYYSELPYVTTRLTFLADEYFNADYLTAACRVEHQYFYRRMLQGDLWAQPRPYPGLNWDTALVVFESKLKREKLYSRFPYFASSRHEQADVFSRSSNSEVDSALLIRDFETIGG